MAGQTFNTGSAVVAHLDDVQMTLVKAHRNAMNGTVVGYDPRTSYYIVEVNGTNLLLSEDNIKAQDSLLYRTNEAAKRTVKENDDAAIQPPSKMQMFDGEIERLFGARKQKLEDALNALRSTWATPSEGLSPQVTEFIQYAMKFLDHLIVLVGLAHEESDIREAMKSFTDILEMNSEIQDDKQVVAWVSLQLDQLRDL